MIPISFVPHDPDHWGVFWTENPHPLPEVILSKETGMPLVIADNPLHSVAIGSGQCLEEFEALKQVLISSNGH